MLIGGHRFWRNRIADWRISGRWRRYGCAGLTGNRDLDIPAETVVHFKLAQDPRRAGLTRSLIDFSCQPEAQRKNATGENMVRPNPFLGGSELVAFASHTIRKSARIL